MEKMLLLLMTTIYPLPLVLSVLEQQSLIYQEQHSTQLLAIEPNGLYSWVSDVTENTVYGHGEE